jgi:kinesin family protein C1
VSNLSSHRVSEVSDVLDLLRTAQAHRTVAATKMNAQSSRSHSVFLLKASARHALNGQTRNGHLVLVDLAGSERIEQSGVQGEQLKEAVAINKSLSSLGNVIVALSKKQAHVPFRDSTLTHLLQHCLGGDSKCLMLVNVSPAPVNSSETLCSLRFAQKVNSCEVGVAKKHGTA